MAKRQFKFDTLKECFECLRYLHTSGNDAVEHVARELHERIGDYYNGSTMHQIKSALSTFLEEVVKFYGRLLHVHSSAMALGATTRQDRSDDAPDDIIDILLRCIPKFLAAMYFLRYKVTMEFVHLGGGGWADDRPGWGGGFYIKDDLYTYLHAKSGSDYGGIIPGGFNIGDLKFYAPSGYSQGKDMASDLDKILSKIGHNFFRDVFVLSTVTNFGTDRVNTANAIGLVGVFCDIVENDKDGDVQSALMQHVTQLVKPLDWKYLQVHCMKLKRTRINTLLSPQAFSHTGQSQTSDKLNKVKFATKVAQWLRDNLHKVQENLRKISTGYSINDTRDTRILGEYFTSNLFPYGFIFGFEPDQAYNKMPSNLLQTWQGTIDNFRKDGDEGLLKTLKDILEGKQGPKMYDSNDLSLNQGKRGEGAKNLGKTAERNQNGNKGSKGPIALPIASNPPGKTGSPRSPSRIDTNALGNVAPTDQAATRPLGSPLSGRVSTRGTPSLPSDPHRTGGDVRGKTVISPRSNGSPPSATTLVKGSQSQGPLLSGVPDIRVGDRHTGQTYPSTSDQTNAQDSQQVLASHRDKSAQSRTTQSSNRNDHVAPPIGYKAAMTGRNYKTCRGGKPATYAYNSQGYICPEEINEPHRRPFDLSDKLYNVLDNVQKKRDEEKFKDDVGRLTHLSGFPTHFSSKRAQLSHLTQAGTSDNVMWLGGDPLPNDLDTTSGQQSIANIQDAYRGLYDMQKIEDEELERALEAGEKKKRLDEKYYATQQLIGQKYLQTDRLKGADVHFYTRPISRKVKDPFDIELHIPKRTVPESVFDLDFHEDPPPPRSDLPFDAGSPFTPAKTVNFELSEIAPASQRTETVPDNIKRPNVQMCLPAWTTHTPTDDFDDIPEMELFSMEPLRTVRDMLRWLAGIRRPKHLEVLEKCINSALQNVPDGVPGNPTLCVNNSKLKLEDLIKALKLASIFSSSVLSAIEPDWKQKSSRSGTVKRMDTHHDQNPDGCALLCQLQDYVYACYHQLAFLRSQCAGDKFRGGWMGCQFGRDVTADSPLQAFLTDAYYSKFNTHLFDPCDVCLKSRIRMGFRKGDFSKSAKDGSYLYYLLSPSCSGDDDPLMTLSSYLNCLTRRTPRTTGELVSYFHHFGSELHKDGIGILSDMGKALSTPHPECPEWDHLGRQDLDAVRGIRVSESPVSKHDNDHAGTLSTLVGCDITNVQCTKLLSPITHRAYAIYSPCFAYTYLSWAVYLADTLRESLDRLHYDFTRHEFLKCGSIHHCHDALPYLYFHGFTPPEGTSTSLVTCSQVITKLEEVVNGGPIARLINCMDKFLYRVRWPFIYTVIALWSTAFLLFAHTALYRLDVLRIQSHLMRSRDSHVIDVKALLTDGTKMPSLYDIDYFDDEALAHAWNRIY